MRRLTLSLLLAGSFALAGLAAAVPAARAADCRFVLGFATLRALIPQQVGSCLQNEQHNPANGDGFQQTTGGLLVWRKADNHTAFTDGYRTWVNGPFGLQQRLNSQHFAWEGQGSGAGPQLITPGSPVLLLRSYYVLINERDYAGAYALWANPPAPYAQFVAGYATTARVAAAFGQPEANNSAGHFGADIPTVLIAQQTNGSVQSFGGCYTVVMVDPGVLPAGSPPPPWQIQVAQIHALSGVTAFSDPAAQAALAGPCPGHA